MINISSGNHLVDGRTDRHCKVKDIITTNILKKFHAEVLTRINSLTPGDYIALKNVLTKSCGGYGFQQTITIFKLVQDIIGTNLLTKFHDDWTINVASRENAKSPGGHVFKPTGIILKIVQDIIGTNLVTMFHEDQAINVASRVLTRKNALLHVGNIGTNLLTKFYDDRTSNVTSRVLTRKNALSPSGYVFQPTGIIFELVQNVNGTNLLTKFHHDQIINMASRKNVPSTGGHDFQATVTIFELVQPYRKNAPPNGSHVFQPNGNISKIIQDIIGTNLVTKSHEDRTINVVSRVLTSHIMKNTPPSSGHTINVASRVLTRKNAPPPGSHIFQPTGNIFKLIHDINGTNRVTKFRKDWTNNVASRVKNAHPHGGHVFNQLEPFLNSSKISLGQIFWPNFMMIGQKNVASRVLTRKNAPPPGGHVFQPTATIFKLVQDIIGTNLLTKFHDHQTINVYIRKNALLPGGHVFQPT
ncbi:hypothetical protein DPMN_024002 [Dreissena polymorpha]|uniref:Uncharacterized protein n=1 Tax=Dreissena polymorpha TaxID=45954 RepID=A0A9D4RAF2_DREPO|nr:hypothetical protein DPMN_024002 [Dreissena polymorpha]